MTIEEMWAQQPAQYSLHDYLQNFVDDPGKLQDQIVAPEKRSYDSDDIDAIDYRSDPRNDFFDIAEIERHVLSGNGNRPNATLPNSPEIPDSSNSTPKADSKAE